MKTLVEDTWASPRRLGSCVSASFGQDRAWTSRNSVSLQHMFGEERTSEEAKITTAAVQRGYPGERAVWPNSLS